MKTLTTSLLSILMSSFISIGLANDHLYIAEFSKQNLSNWNEKEFNHVTIYSFVKDGEQTVLKAESNDSASGLFKEQTIDLKKYPYLNWRWKNAKALNVSDEKTKQGDDYGARIYLIKDGFFFWNTQALNYVWATHEQKNSFWPSAYAPDNSMMIALRSQGDSLNTWFTEKRHIADDFEKAFGVRIDQLDGIAIMSDSDDSHDTTTSYFGDIYFSKD